MIVRFLDRRKAGQLHVPWARTADLAVVFAPRRQPPVAIAGLAARLAIGGVGRRALAGGARDDRLGLAQSLTFLRPGDVRMVWKPDRLGGPCPT